MPSIYLGLAFLYGSYSSTGCVLLKNSVRQTAAVQLHEFLHVTAGMAKSIGYKATPDVHWGPGWTSSNGGIDGDNVWYRKTISSIYSDSFWQNVPLIKNARKRYNQKIAGNYFSWSKVKEDWQFELPQITAEFLQNRTQLSELKFDFIKLNDTCYQFLVNGFSPDEVLSPVITEAKANDLTFNNALTLSTPVYPPEISDPWGGYKTHPIESMAVIRYKTHDSYKDLVFIRIEVADAVLERFKIREIPASEQILGYVTTIFDNDEFNSSPFLLVEIDLGETFPASELAAIGVNEDRYVDQFHAVASCDVPYQEDFEPQAAVDSFGQTYFWSTREFYENETFTVDFEKVLEANQIVSVQQASKSHPADFIRNGAFEISLDGENWEEIARISKKNFEVTITQEFRYVRLKALSNTEHWIAIRDISLGPLQREFDGYLPIGKVCGR
jgi:hypothetical protein